MQQLALSHNSDSSPLILGIAMAKLESIEKQLNLWKVIDEDDDDQVPNRLFTAFEKLPKNLKAIALAVFDLNERGRGGDEDDDDADDSNESANEKKREAALKKKRELQGQFDTLSIGDRKRILSGVAPSIAEHLEEAWQWLKSVPYMVGYIRKAFRAPKDPEVTLQGRIEWLNSFAEAIEDYQQDVITLAWLAQWAQHAFTYNAECVVPVLISAMNKGGKQGDEVFDILYKTVTREHPIGVMGDHVIQSLLGSHRQSGWEIMEKTLLAAQRQEGLRQSILGNADVAHPQAFQRMLRLILDKDLIRFSSVARCVNSWLGLLWDSVSAKILTENVEAILSFLQSPSERKKGLASDHAETVFRALWACAFEDALAAIPLATKLLKHKSDDIRFVAAWILLLIGLKQSKDARQTLIEDANLQVAMLAAVGTDGLDISSELDEEVDSDDELESTSKKDAFEKIERLYARLPEKPIKLKPIVWPWTERKIERSMVTNFLMQELDDRPPTRMLPYLKSLNSWEQRSLIQLLADQKKWDKLTRATLFELAGHASADVREAAFEAVDKQTLESTETELLEGYLTRQAADLRTGVIRLIIKGKDAAAIGSADRLLLKGDRNQRFAGLEILRQLSEANRLRKECQLRATAYRGSQKKLSSEEETQLKAIAESDREVLSLDNALGLMNPDGRSKVVLPQKKKVQSISKAAIACIKSLDDLVHQHRTATVRTKSYRGFEDKLLGEMDAYDFPSLNMRKPLEPQWKKFPMFEIWEQWNKKRPAATKDKDGLELVRALFAVDMFDNYSFDEVKQFAKKSDRKMIAVSILGEIEVPKLRYLSALCALLDWLVYTEIQKGSTDFLLDCAENTYAHVPDDMMKELLVKEKKPKKRYSWSDDESDWRNEEVFKLWPEFLEQFIRRTDIKLSSLQTKRRWELQRFNDEPIPGAPRQRISLSETMHAFQDKLATFDDIVDCLLGPNRGEYSEFGELAALSSRQHSKEFQAVIDKTKGLGDLVNRIRTTLLEIELARGEGTTVATKPALALSSIYGLDNLFRILAALNKGKIKVDRGYSSNAGESRNASLTHFLKVTYPTDKDTLAEFKRLAKQAIADGYCNEERLLELSFLAPQWSKLIGEQLGWDGFSEGLYWFLSHMSTWHSEATEAAASVEGLEDDPEDEIDDDDDDEDSEGDSGKESSDSIPKPEKLTAWERLVLERTPLTSEERSEGAVDVAWFHRTWKILGEKRWRQMAEAAKFAANSSQANKAQFLADVLLGNKPRKDLIDGIQKKNLKEHVRLLGLLPLADGAKRDKDLMERYEVLQGYKKYARGLSSLTKPAAMRAAEIGMNNLARLSGFPDPLRLEWALEAESIKDLAKGPIAVTKDGITVTLQLDSDAKPALSIARGDKTLKSIPSAVKKKYVAIAELAERATELKKKASRIKQSLEMAMCRGDVIGAAELIQLFEHAILAPQLSKLVLVGEGILGYPDKGGKALRDFSGKLEPVKKSEQLRIAHSSDLLESGNWDKWQQECFRAERIQPFKQVFRELYVVTKQEKKDQTSSQRFAGQQIGPRQAMTLWNSRGWNTQDEVFKIFHDLSIIAEVTFQYDYGTAAEIEGLTVEQVQFRKRDEFKPMKLVSVPQAIFSEVMRDIDLVVSVAHRGEVDPEASASTVEMRSALIRETCVLLGLKNVSLKGTHAIINGTYGQYSLHLGSAGIHRMPGGALAILPVHAQHRGRLFLPFADDDPRTAEIMSKVLLLARDEEIQDPTILDQLGAPVSKRRVLVVEESKKGSASTKLTKSTPGSASPNVSASTAVASTFVVGSTAGGKRYFEFKEGSSQKFWEIELSGNSLTTKWGRIGAGGQSKTKDFGDSIKAKAEYDKLIQEKTGKGYKESQ
jgi:predicted DNA-binding WGR domain protein